MMALEELPKNIKMEVLDIIKEKVIEGVEDALKKMKIEIFDLKEKNKIMNIILVNTGHMEGIL